MSEQAAGATRRFSLAHLLLVVPWVALVIDAWSPIGDNSFLWHVRAGSLQAASGSVLTADPFSFTMAGEPWLTQSWLAELLYGYLEQGSGLGFVPWMLLTVSALAMVGVALIAFRLSGSVTATAIILILTTVSLISFLVPRPVIFSYLLFTLVILAWERPQARWSLPFLFWIWASVHGTFFVGLAYVGLRLLSRKEWRALPTAFVAGGATLLTAHGLGVVRMLIDFSEARPYLRLLTEWRTPELFSPVFFPVFLGILVIIHGATKGRLAPLDLVVIAPFFALSLTALRSVPPAWLALVVPISMALGGIGKGLPQRFGIVPSAVLAIAVIVLPFFLIGDSDLAEDRFPVEAAAALGPGPVFHNDVVGGYLIWADGPDRQVYIDDRAELFQERMEEFVAIRGGDMPWAPEFEEFGITQALLAEDEPMVGWLKDAGWSTTVTAGGFVLLSEG